MNLKWNFVLFILFQFSMATLAQVEEMKIEVFDRLSK